MLDLDPDEQFSNLDPVKRGSGLLEDETRTDSDNFVFKMAK
jgi:hypothetical protein